ncbi:hypothetical protein [Aliivibrio sifiae]|uniref:Uncharacterized protein n=1 Tax=Aliivibrio sifiae TaxID=566293 RepID=A0A2S7X884_9GAMM|nr:hypothetical protein [Aliivibrio sifiae]PQJ87574.1 hypothetical protein BTO23_15835 [Aliivibrio sifiae]GLR73178.1 hypothetical protein GCM10007855_00510 [Aliivibrio sifiae]
MYIKFNKNNISATLPEKRPKMIFSNPDLFIVFNEQVRFVLWEDILDKIDEKWLKNMDLWESNFDFGNNEDDYDRQFDNYKTIELLQFPEYESIDTPETSAFIYDKNRVLYISEKFISDLKKAGCVDIWYDTTAPYGRY